MYDEYERVISAFMIAILVCVYNYMYDILLWP